MAVDPTRQDLERLLAEDDGAPVVMLNLLRFAPEGAALYAEYSKRAAPFLAKYGGTLLYAGAYSTPLVTSPDHTWDAILVVRYPTRDAFLQMIADPGYQEITPLRTRALSEAVLQATTAWPSSP
ncbi:uncharacterized protein (DUF1330 family) [Actinocorallia herbida]|uniref:Uncharacterized protein (DUF1330 family) n=1 Tax=Actinocorallia herbida TaxID=58109 RepID=A0A3N1D6G0_9ACTN|nr:DUF1330 domain-containing protein [Actinocorallia herbida]ROO89110.1 uncharacterized protein (DUF1330 family) [Actinocorallia herbida]